MRAKRYKLSPTQLKVGALTGGVQENKPQYEMRIGDLIRGFNYQEVDGLYTGYRSMFGYEVFDGTQSPTSVAVDVTDVDGVTEYDDTDREARRSLIIASNRGSVS